MPNYDEIVKVRVHAGSPDLWQEVHAYLTYHFIPFGRVVDVVIRMPLYLKPDDILTDVSETLRAQHIMEDIEDLKYTLSPEIL